MKTLKTILVMTLLSVAGWAQLTFNPPTVTAGATNTISWTAGTVNNGGHPVAISAGTGTVTLNKTDCSNPGYANCNFVFANSSGTVSVTTTQGTAIATGNTLLALIETGAVTTTQVVYPWQSGTMWLGAGGPLVAGFSSAPTPAVAGATDLGSASLPWGNLWLGTAATNNIQINALATAAARKVVLADQGGTAALAFADPNTTTKVLAFDLSGMTAAKTLTIAASSANSRTYTLPDIGGAATFAFTNPTSAQSILFNGGLTASGAVANDFSGSTGTFKTSTGAGTFGGSSNTFNGAAPQITLGTASSLVGSIAVNNATSGTLTIQPPTGALGSTTISWPDVAGGMPTVQQCGATGSGNQTCTPAATTRFAQVIVGQSTLSANSAVITFSPGFTSSTSYWCVANDVTTRANPVQMVSTSATTATITNTTGATDNINFICAGN